MKKKRINEEIDLSEILDIVWNKKIIVLIIAFLVSLFIFLNEINKKPTKEKIIASVEISPISTYVEEKYKIFNLYSKSISSNKSLTEDKFSLNLVESTLEIDPLNNVELGINRIDKKFLYDLFFDDLKQSLKKVIKSLNFINEQNYSTKTDYENEIDNLVSSFKLTDRTIEFDATKDLDWVELLKLLEIETNNNVRFKLIQMFDDFIEYLVSLNGFAIRDIEIQLNQELSESERSHYKKLKTTINSDDSSKRLKNIFNKSPIYNSDTFYAARINYNLIRFDKGKNINEISILTKLFISAILGLLLGIFFVLILSAIQKRK
jgi:hypothetical protein